MAGILGTVRACIATLNGQCDLHAPLSFLMCNLDGIVCVRSGRLFLRFTDDSGKQDIPDSRPLPNESRDRPRISAADTEASWCSSRRWGWCWSPCHQAPGRRRGASAGMSRRGQKRVNTGKPRRRVSGGVPARLGRKSAGPGGLRPRGSSRVTSDGSARTSPACTPGRAGFLLSLLCSDQRGATKLSRVRRENPLLWAGEMTRSAREAREARGARGAPQVRETRVV